MTFEEEREARRALKREAVEAEREVEARTWLARRFTGGLVGVCTGTRVYGALCVLFIV